MGKIKKERERGGRKGGDMRNLLPIRILSLISVMLIVDLMYIS